MTLTVESLNRAFPPPSPKTQLVILGLTPGHAQHKLLLLAKERRHAAFAGPMRRTIHDYFQRLGIDRIFGIEDPEDIYASNDFAGLIHMTSLLSDPVYVNGRNYSGTPKPWSNDKLREMMARTLAELSQMKQKALIIPLGEVVAEAIRNFSNLDHHHFVLYGFPHPSGANGHKERKFVENFTSMKKTVREFKIWREEAIIRQLHA